MQRQLNPLLPILLLSLGAVFAFKGIRHAQRAVPADLTPVAARVTQVSGVICYDSDWSGYKRCELGVTVQADDGWSGRVVARVVFIHRRPLDSMRDAPAPGAAMTIYRGERAGAAVYMAEGDLETSRYAARRVALWSCGAAAVMILLGAAGLIAAYRQRRDALG
jgi:hypothetical protein